MAKKRKYRRTTHYPGYLGIAVTEATQEAVEGVADQAGWSVAQTVRECINVGLPVVKSRLHETGPEKRPGLPAHR